MMYDEETLNKVWSIELEIMEAFHNFCEEHQLRYSLAFGSLIGAV